MNAASEGGKRAGKGRALYTLAEILEICERFYQRDGFVKWADVARALGVSRTAIQTRLNDAVRRGDLDSAVLDRYRSIGSRAAATREREKARKEAYNLTTFPITLTEENAAWVRKEAAFKGVYRTEFINGLISKARESTEHPPST
jgi:histone acetyltransferase (RNA polymerase elongator complex component)